jgi:hypothetical protein
VTSGPTNGMIPECAAFRLLKAERIAWGQVPFRPLAEDGAQRFVDRVTASKHWLSRAPYRLSVPAGGRKVQVLVDPASGRSYPGITPTSEYSGRLLPTITLGGSEDADVHYPHHRNPWVILHQLAHLLAIEEGHSRIFAGTYKNLVERFLGVPSARVLTEHLDLLKVRWVGGGVAPIR